MMLFCCFFVGGRELFGVLDLCHYRGVGIHGERRGQESDREVRRKSHREHQQEDQLPGGREGLGGKQTDQGVLHTCMLVRTKSQQTFDAWNNLLCQHTFNLDQTDYVSLANPPLNDVIHAFAPCTYVDTCIPDKILTIFLLIYSRLCQLVLVVKRLRYE